MVAAKTVDHSAETRKQHNLAFLQQTGSGVVTLFGYGSKMLVDRGHLLLEDGIGSERKRIRVPRVGHGIKRVVFVGTDGIVSLAALRWLADQQIAFAVLERNGSVVACTGPVRPSDARLRRAQSLSSNSSIGLHIARELIRKKILGQAHVATKKLLNETSGQEISTYETLLDQAMSFEEIRTIESQAAAAYWATWKNLPVSFPKRQLSRVPRHWQSFETRRSEISGSQRIATNPVNAILNYLYAVLESESRLALATLGLDPGLGFLHLDNPSRDSLACDLMEPVRPEVDSFVIDWITRETLKREWFLEQRNGNCRLDSALAVNLSDTARMWGRSVAPIAEWITRELWVSVPKRGKKMYPPSRLTHDGKRMARSGIPFASREGKIALPKHVCVDCGTEIPLRSRQCSNCAQQESRNRMLAISRAGRLKAHSTTAQNRRSETQRAHANARSDWKESDKPAWLTREVYANKIASRLHQVTNGSIVRHLKVSRMYASRIRKGHCPHPRHWQALADLVNLTHSKSPNNPVSQARRLREYSKVSKSIQLTSELD
jgi:CRISPR-associated endonuclease Cas1